MAAASPFATLVAALLAVAVALWLNPQALQQLQSLLHAPGASPSSESVSTPSDALDYAALARYSAARSEHALRWGTYRSGLYHGIRSRTYPFSVSAGLLWGSTHEDVSQLRHECRQEDRLQKYGWLQHDGRHYGWQSIEDQFNRVELHTHYARLNGEQGVDGWASRVNVLPLQPRDERLRKKQVDATKLSLFFYVDLTCGDESVNDACRQKLHGLMDVASEPDQHSCDGPDEAGKTCSTVSFTSPGVEGANSDATNAPFEFQLVAQLKTSEKVRKTEVRYAGVKDATVLNVKERLVSLATRASPPDDAEIVLDNLIDDEATLVVIQATVEFDAGEGAIEEGDVVFDLVFHEGRPMAAGPASLRQLVTSTITTQRHAFEEKFEQTFQLHSQKGYNSSQVAFARAAFSNLIGGIGFFYGSSLVQHDPSDPSAIEESPRKPLFTAVPSRSFFPRGFVWDEGFHQLGISSFDEEITRDVLVHWLGLMEEDGYIAREQILGQTARRRVPREFLVQHVEHANPPTLLLTLEKMLKSWERKGTSEDPENVAFVKLVFPFLERWYTWLMATQKGPVSEDEIATLRWRGRHSSDGKLIANTLASGLDDYPRAYIPSDVEMHVDLLCWMVKASEILSTLGYKISLSADKQAQLERNKKRLLAALEQVHWSEQYQSFFDVGEHSDAGHVEQHVVVRCRNDQTGQTTDTTASYEQLKTSRETVCPLTHPTYLFPLGDGQGGLKLQPVFVADEQPTLRHVKHIGYVSLFPLLLQVLPSDSPKLEAVLSQLAHPQLLWSPFGLRSIATNDLFYEQENAQGDAPYWRGSIWINLNYLALRALHHYGHTPGPYETTARELYAALRENVVDTIYREYERTGYLWEQYSGNVNAGEQYGRGQRCHPFSGWTALVVNIMAEIY